MLDIVSEHYNSHDSCLLFPGVASTALATHTDHLNRGLLGRMPPAADVCVREEKKGRGGEANDRQLGLAVSCHSVPIMTSLASNLVPPVPSALCTPQVLLRRPADRDCKGKAWRESRNEPRAHFPRCSWLPPASEDLREHFQNKEIVCVGAQIANPRMYAHLHTDRDALTLWDIKKCFSNSF